MSRFFYNNSKWLAVVVAAFAMIGGASPSQAADRKQVNFYAYADYVDAASIKAFEKSTGIKVVYDKFDSVLAVEAKLLSGASGYDVVNGDNITTQRLAKAGIVQKLDKSKLPNWKNLDPAILQKMAEQDPGNNYLVPYFHGIDGFAYNVKRKNSIMKDAPTDSYAMIFNPDIVKKFNSCGVNFLDSSADVMAMALIYIGKDPNPKTPADVDAAMDVLWKVRPYVTSFDSSTYIDGLANGDLCLSMVWGGDHITAMKKAESGNTGVQLTFTLAKEGTAAWFDGFFIPTSAKHVDEAYAFLNALLEPKFAAANTNLVNYANANLPSRPMIEKRIADDPGAYPAAADFAKIKPFLNTPNRDMDEYITKAWNKLKSGRK